MNQNRWQMVNEIFHAALEVPTSERPDFVAKASGSDPSLADEVNQLLQADLDAGSYIESPIANGDLLRAALDSLAPALQAGDMFCGRFRILRSVGEGGMGHVYEALDEELGVHVALKMIRPEIASNPEALARFRQEVRLARRITHPNVCRTFDINHETRIGDKSSGVSIELVFLTMEFLEGETLAAKIARDGPLPLDLAAELARQIADALQAAHALGVIHRDIKPANIMLAPAPGTTHGIRAVITDFGLARAETFDSQKSLSGISNRANPIGTLAYMAPEQLSGAPVSAVTDVYAFGLLLFEMATGKRAFPSNSLLSGITQRLGGPPPDPSVHAPTLPDAWRKAIASCLQVAPEDRSPGVSDVIAILEGDRRYSPPRRARVLPALRAWLTWPRNAVALLILCAAVSLFWAGLRYSGLRADSKVTPGALVYFPPVKNQTGEKALDNVTELIQAGLAQSTQINLLDQGRVGDTLQRMTKPPDTVIDEPIAREIAMRNGAPRVVFANVSGSQGNYRLDVDVQQPDNTPTRFRDHWKKSFTWQSAPSANGATIPQDLLVSVRNASDWIRKEVGESANDIARLNAPPEDVTTGNWEALGEYSIALRLQFTRETAQAIMHLEKAVGIDPSFAAAYGQLGDLQNDLNRFEDGNRSYSRALELAAQDRLSLRERDRIAGQSAMDGGDFQTAEDAFRDYALFYPRDYSGWFYQGYQLMMLGRKDEAIAVLQKACELSNGEYVPYLQLGKFYVAKGNLKEAEEMASTLNGLHHAADAAYIRGLALFEEKKFDEAEHTFRSMLTSDDPYYVSMGYELLARLAAEQGKDEAAVSILNEGLRMDISSGNKSEQASKYLDRGYLMLKLQRYEAILPDVESAMELDRSPANLQLAAWVLEAGSFGAPKSVAGQMRAYLATLPENLKETAPTVYGKIAWHRVRGELLLAKGQWQAAVEAMRKADALDAPATPRQYLGNALELAAGHEPNEDKVSVLRLEAAEAYGRVIHEAGLTWVQTRRYPPGFLNDQREAYLRVAAQVSPVAGDVQDQLKALETDRPGDAVAGATRTHASK